MKVTATTLPRRSPRESACPSAAGERESRRGTDPGEPRVPAGSGNGRRRARGPDRHREQDDRQRAAAHATPCLRLRREDCPRGLHRERRTVNVEPCPSAALAPRACRRAARRSARASVSPSPVPSRLRASSLPAWRNSSKTRSWSSGAMPMPVSAHARSRPAPSASAAPRRSTRPPSGRELDRVGQQVEDDLLDLALVRLDPPSPRRPSATARCRGAPRARCTIVSPASSADGQVERCRAPAPCARPRPWTGRGCR